ncbi:MAG TPA: orotidine 5'-phosphate decarboxylase / HUMPS family protein [Atribacteraceae bacterium]|nr:orotidine 5'-phosphate decarboxylase / HUMPS family protein [Atribacteraceae bacterium]
MRTRLLLALDILSLSRARELCGLLAEVVDIIEVGTPLIVCHGLPVVSKVREWTGGGRPIFADTKIVDAGRWETLEAVRAGADMVSVLAGASEATLSEVKQSVVDSGAEMVVDTIDLSPRDESKIEFIDHLLPDYLCLHLSTDVVKRGGTILDHRKVLPLTASPPERIMVAGGINLHNLREVLKAFRPAVVVVGSGLSAQENPLAVAREMRRYIDESGV